MVLLPYNYLYPISDIPLLQGSPSCMLRIAEGYLRPDLFSLSLTSSDLSSALCRQRFCLSGSSVRKYYLSSYHVATLSLQFSQNKYRYTKVITGLNAQHLRVMLVFVHDHILEPDAAVVSVDQCDLCGYVCRILIDTVYCTYKLHSLFIIKQLYKADRLIKWRFCQILYIHISILLYVVDDFMNKGYLLLVQRLIIYELRECCHCRVVIKLGYLTNKDTKWSITVFSLIVLFSAELLRQYPLKLLIVSR